MGLDLGKVDKLIEGTWVDYDDEISFKIRYVSPKFSRMSKKKYTKTKVIRGSRQENMSRTGEEEWDKDLWDHMIEDWKGITINGKPAECNRENKKMLSDCSTDHANFIMEYAMSVANFQDKEVTEEEVKNSETSSTSN